MCFSPTASFTASAVLGAIGVAGIAKTRASKALPLAVVPLIFAVQQAIEGGLWLSIQGQAASVLMFTTLFLFFALFWWPAFAPFTAYFAETVRWRRIIIGLFTAIGFGLGAYLYINFLLHPEPATILNHCVYYRYSVPNSSWAITLYMLVTIGAGLLSSKKSLQIFWLVAGALAFLSWRIYLENFTSVWCFFAAIVSVLLYHFEFASVPLPRIFKTTR